MCFSNTVWGSNFFRRNSQFLLQLLQYMTRLCAPPQCRPNKPHKHFLLAKVTGIHPTGHKLINKTNSEHSWHSEVTLFNNHDMAYLQRAMREPTSYTVTSMLLVIARDYAPLLTYILNMSGIWHMSQWFFTVQFPWDNQLTLQLKHSRNESNAAVQLTFCPDTVEKSLKRLPVEENSLH